MNSKSDSCDQGRRFMFRIGGAKVRKLQFFGALCMKYHNIGLCARSAPKIFNILHIYQLINVEFNGFVVSYSAILTFSCITYYEFFKLSKLLGGKTICLPPPQYFHWWGDCPPPCPPGSTPLTHSVVHHLINM